MRHRRRRTTRRNSILCKIHVHDGGHAAIVPRVAPVAPVVRRPTLDVVDHAPSELDLPPPAATAAAAPPMRVGRGRRSRAGTGTAIATRGGSCSPSRRGCRRRESKRVHRPLQGACLPRGRRRRRRRRGRRRGQGVAVVPFLSGGGNARDGSSHRLAFALMEQSDGVSERRCTERKGKKVRSLRQDRHGPLCMRSKAMSSFSTTFDFFFFKRSEPFGV